MAHSLGCIIVVGVHGSGRPSAAAPGAGLGVIAAAASWYEPISNAFVTKLAFEEYATPTVLGQPMVVVAEVAKVQRFPTDTRQVIPEVSAVALGTANDEPVVIHADRINMVEFGPRSRI